MQQSLVKALLGKQPQGMNVTDWKDSETSVASTIRLCLADEMMYHVIDEESLAAIWLKLESRLFVCLYID